MPMTKEETTSHTVATKNVSITATINAHKDHDVAIVDLPGVSLHTDVDQNDYMVHIVLHGELSELMVNVKVDLLLYWKYVINDKNCRMMFYVKL